MEGASMQKSKAKRSKKKMDFFNLGVRALQHVAPGLPICYVCPLCLTLFLPECLQTENTLTLEDVPPKAFGGKELVITCHSCNSEGGRTVDAELAKYVNARDFLRGKMKKARRGQMTKGGVK